jgi:hypothetical protein
MFQARPKKRGGTCPRQELGFITVLTHKALGSERTQGLDTFGELKLQNVREVRVQLCAERSGCPA